MWMVLAQQAQPSGQDLTTSAYYYFGVGALLLIGMAAVIVVLWRHLADKDTELTAKAAEVTDLTGRFEKLAQAVLAANEKQAELLPQVGKTVERNTDVLQELAMDAVRRRRG